ncbi:putative sodium-coupled neutral amino acid transporter 10 isoform X2 [Lepeophtheirus salmonis]|uniref:putative sodium-coupled neutral amino acid transporter 10 isoform X2 n=1 Tax=Lepeophtheirus salmonis TaxID=72036 RepID=UPI001AE295EF|nr:putative sodium-coupled neutral amino acid transporter 10 isoform X2 [Lepeophtheirus salmonis]
MSFNYVITIANSIIGVSILAMPFCFKECGILLASLLLISAGIMVKIVCHLMLKSALIARRNNYEILAFHTFGYSGKIAVEICMIGFMMGTCVAFFVVMGDLGPPIASVITGLQNNSNLRVGVLIVLGLCVALPLALLRNVGSLSGICVVSVSFYASVLCHILFSASGKLMDALTSDNLNYWRPAGILQCFPIFIMALSCQPQVFEIYDSLPDPNIYTMYSIISSAVNLCTIVYICFGFFGYIMFYTQEIGGNILVEFDPSITVELIKLGFVLSIAVSFPLVIFPCRTALHSLLYKKTHSLTSSDSPNGFIPYDRFNKITFFIVICTLFIGILIPDIELVLGLIGSTIGSVINIIIPALIFLKLTTIDNTERISAKFIAVIGVSLMIFGSYGNLFMVKSPEISHGELKVAKNLNAIDPQNSPTLKDLSNLVPSIANNLEVAIKKNASLEETVKPLIHKNLTAQVKKISNNDNTNKDTKIVKEEEQEVEAVAPSESKAKVNVKSTFKSKVNKSIKTKVVIPKKEN